MQGKTGPLGTDETMAGRITTPSLPAIALTPPSVGGHTLHGDRVAY